MLFICAILYAACADTLEPVAEEETPFWADLLKEETLRGAIADFEPALILWF